MIDLAKYKTVYNSIILLIMLFLVVLFAVKTGPSGEAYLDIRVDPPEKVRKTDFSWITVNEWFNSQTFIITSQFLLEGIETDISKNRLKKIVSAKRLGAADIIRISARSNDSFADLKKVVSGIADLYLEQLGKTEDEKATDEVKETIQKEKDDRADYNTLFEEYMEITKEINVINRGLENYEIELKSLEAELTGLRGVKERMEQIERELIRLNARLMELRSVYTDNWPEISKLKPKVDMLEKEKKRLDSKLQATLKIENAKHDATNRINKDRQNLKELQNKLKAVDKDLKAHTTQKQVAVKKKRVPEKKTVSGSIITPPTYRKVPEFKVRLLIGLSFGLFLWFLISRLLDHLFRKQGIYL